MNRITLQVNGEPRSVSAPATVEDLLRTLALDPRTVVVELNERIVRRPQHPATALVDGDRVEIVHFVGGG